MSRFSTSPLAIFLAVMVTPWAAPYAGAANIRSKMSRGIDATIIDNHRVKFLSSHHPHRCPPSIRPYLHQCTNSSEDATADVRTRFVAGHHPKRRNRNRAVFQSRGLFVNFVKYVDSVLKSVYDFFIGDVDNVLPTDDYDQDNFPSSADTSWKDSWRDNFRTKSYKGYHLIRMWPRTKEAVEELNELNDEPGVQLWLPPMKNLSTDMVIPPNIVPDLMQQLKDSGIEHKILAYDIQNILNIQKRKYDSKIESNKWRKNNLYEAVRGNKKGKNRVKGEQSASDLSLHWTRYPDLDEIFVYLEYLEDAYDNIAKIENIGRSSEGRDLKLIRISASSNASKFDNDNYVRKPAVWIDAGMHAREWISTAVALYIVEQLVENYEMYRHLTENIDWYILPVANPDGYVYSHAVDRLWTKSRSPNEDTDDFYSLRRNNKYAVRHFADFHFYSRYDNRLFMDDWDSCKGVDLNRNWDSQWSAKDASSSSPFSNHFENPCHDSYAGREPFSEPETRAMSNFILENKDRIVVYLSLHSYSQTWLMPWSYTKSKDDADYDDMLYIGRRVVESIKKNHGVRYDFSTTSNYMNPNFGTSDDWAKNKAGIKYSYTVELRDKGTFGYLLPPSQILATGRETFTAVRTLIKSVLNTHYNNNYSYQGFGNFSNSHSNQHK